MNLNFKDKVVVVGGGEGSVGKVLMQMLRDEGAMAVSLDISLGHDLGDPTALQEIFTDLKSEYTKIDGYCSLVYGGVGNNEPLTVTPEEITASIKNTLLAGLYPAQESARWMSETGGGGIVMVSSINSMLGTGEFAYDISKGGLNRIAPDLATACGAKGVYISTLCPGTIAHSSSWKDKEETLKRITSAIPDGKVTTPEEVAATILFLLSDYGRMFNGSTVVADRGWSLRPQN